MKNKDLFILTGIMLMNFLAGITVLPFYPIYAQTFDGVTAGQTGMFLAIASTALTIGTIGGGWIADKFKQRKLLILVGAVMGFVAYLLIPLSTQFWHLIVGACIAFFGFGLATTMARTIAGILAGADERGRVFGIINAAVPLAALIGGILGGYVVEQWSIPFLFTVMSAAFVLSFVLALFANDANPIGETTESTIERQPFSAGLPYWLLMFAMVAAFIGLSGVILGRPLAMDGLNFSATAIAGVATVGGIISLPMTFIVGWLSDILGRKNMLISCFLIVIPGLGLLIFAQPLWQFWVSEMGLVFVGIANTVGFALVADLVSSDDLDAAMSYYSAAGWIGTIIGYLVVGYVIEWLGLGSMFTVATVMMIVGFLLILPIIAPTKVKIIPEVQAAQIP